MCVWLGDSDPLAHPALSLGDKLFVEPRGVPAEASQAVSDPGVSPQCLPG